MKLNEHKTGLALGLFVGGVHLLWSLAVLIKVAQVLVNWSMRWHMVAIPVKVKPFSLNDAIWLIIVTAAVGYVFGYVFAWVWNKVHEK